MTAWIKDAACRGMDTKLWFPEHGQGRVAEAAKEVCQACPVRVQCAEYAIDNCEPFGIWGGLNHRERQRIRTERGYAACSSIG